MTMLSYSALVPGWSAYLLLWLFVVYSVLGVVVETIFCLVREGVLESRLGVLYLPLRPMYGVGGVGCTVLLDRFAQQPIVVFLGGMLICSVVEYVAGWVCDLAFGTIAWDYGDRPFHLHGRICLQYSCYWGLLGGLAVYVLTPSITIVVGRLDPELGAVLLTVLIMVGLAAAILTAAGWARSGHRVAVWRAQAEGKDVCVRDTVAGRVVDRLAPDRLMINTFPRTRLARDLMELTGQQRAWVRVAGRQQLRDR